MARRQVPGWTESSSGPPGQRPRAGGLGRDLDGVKVAGHNLLGDLLDEGLGAGTVVVHSEARAYFPALAIHQANGVGLAVDVHAHQ